MNKTIVLIGMSGCGKTTVGKALADQLNRRFIDLDDAIEKALDMSISEIFRHQGEAYFREVEWRLFLENLSKTEAILAAGAGLVPTAVECRREKPTEGCFVYLNPPLERVIDQLSVESERLKRPLLAKGNLEQNVKIQYERRHVHYLGWADVVFASYSKEGLSKSDLTRLLSI